jgi:NADH-quinone oxidoreductase subunit D
VERRVVARIQIRQSVSIIDQALRALPAGPYKVDVPLSIRPPLGESYARIESPKGELGYYVVSDGGTAPYRFHVRAPSLINLSVLKEMVVGSTVADAIVAFGSIDIVIGELDR